MIAYGTRNLIKRISEHYSIADASMKIGVNDERHGYMDDVDLIGNREISFLIINRDINLNIEGIRVPLSNMHTEEEFYDLIEHQVKYDVLQRNDKKVMDMFFDIKQGIIVDLRSGRSATLYKNEFVLCEPAIMYVQSPTLKASVDMNLLIIYMPRDTILIKEIDKKKFDNGGLWVDLHLVTLKTVAKMYSLDKYSVRLTSMPKNGNGDLSASFHQAELIHQRWMNNFNVPADMFKNPLNGELQNQYELLEPVNLYNGENIYTDRDSCTFVKIAGKWVAIEWVWVINNRNQFPLEVQEEITMIESIQEEGNG